MKCGCKECGTLMDHKEQGIFSLCVCPNCLNKCDICLGTNTVLSVAQIQESKNNINNQEENNN